MGAQLDRIHHEIVSSIPEPSFLKDQNRDSMCLNPFILPPIQNISKINDSKLMPISSREFITPRNQQDLSDKNLLQSVLDEIDEFDLSDMKTSQGFVFVKQE